jgi:hypothetical protein
MTEWEEAAAARGSKISSMSGVIPGYGYATRADAQRTDETFCSVMVENLREAKAIMFNVLETAYEMQRDLLLDEFQALRDDIDVFGDEVKARAFHWDHYKPAEWLGRLIDHDYRTLSLLAEFFIGVHDLEKAFLDSKETVQDIKKLEQDVKTLRAKLDELVSMFRERDAICTVQSNALEETYRDRQKEIRTGL